MRNENIHILMDGSHIWGLMALRGVRSLGFPCRLIKAQEIARIGLQGKTPALLLVPGGNARAKAAALGSCGLANIRAWLAGGGSYLGFCGGAGLALSSRDEQAALALCPWPRGAYKSRILHLISGHLRASLNPRGPDSRVVSLPVWWPGRFAPRDGGEVAVLAECLGHEDDFWLADIHLARVPAAIRARWQEARGLDMAHMKRQPLAVRGAYGNGSYILSYSHLETPQSPDANAWLCDILEEACGFAPKTRLVPEWNPVIDAEARAKPAFPCALREAMLWAGQKIGQLLATGCDLRLFFPRTSWLMGWRSGLSGMACNNLRVALAELASMSETDRANAFWEACGQKFLARAEQFFTAGEALLWDTRLGRTLAEDPADGRLARDLAEIFGHPMLGGGLAGELLETLEELIYLAQPEAGDDFSAN